MAIIVNNQAADKENKLIFFVDDEKMILNLVEYVFNTSDEYDVKTYDSGEACLENLTLNPELIVLDQNFLSHPGMISGMDTLKKIKEYNPAIKVVMLTAQGNQELVDEFIKAGATKYLTKDKHFIDSLMAVIKEALEMS